jgi:hypothetical protein
VPPLEGYEVDNALRTLATDGPAIGPKERERPMKGLRRILALLRDPAETLDSFAAIVRARLVAAALTIDCERARGARARPFARSKTAMAVTRRGRRTLLATFERSPESVT